MKTLDELKEAARKIAFELDAPHAAVDRHGEYIQLPAVSGTVLLLPEWHPTMSGAFYHFCMDILYPLLWLFESSQLVRQNLDGSSFQVFSCGQFNGILLDVLPFLTIIEPLDMAGHPTAESYVYCRTFDISWPPRRNLCITSPMLRSFSEWLRSRSSLSRQTVAAWPEVTGPLRRVLVVERLGPDGEGEAGRYLNANHRTVPNLKEVVEQLSAMKGVQLAVASLEAMNYRNQIALFNEVDIVIAQHGAALAHIPWLRKGASVIEITPKSYFTINPQFEGQNFSKSQFFQRICQALEIQWLSCEQETPHSEIPPARIRELVEHCILARTERAGRLTN